MERCRLLDGTPPRPSPRWVSQVCRSNRSAVGPVLVWRPELSVEAAKIHHRPLSEVFARLPPTIHVRQDAGSAQLPTMTKGAKRRGGGGPYRAFMSERMSRMQRSAQQQQPSAEALSAAGAEYRALKAAGGAEWDRLCEIGSLVTQAHRARPRAAPKKRKAARLTDVQRQSLSAFQDAAVRPGHATLAGQEPQSGALVATPDNMLANNIHKELERLTQESRLQTQQAVLRERAECVQLDSWSEAAGAAAEELQGLGPIPPQPEPSSEAFGITSLPWRLPAISIVQRLAQKAPQSAWPPLLSDWQERHRLITLADAEPIGPLPAAVSPSICQKAGVCLCSGRGKIVAAFVQQLQQRLRLQTRCKDTPFREHLDAGRLVIELRRAEKQSHFFAVAHAHLVTWDATLLPLMPWEGDAPTLRAAEALGHRILQVQVDEPTMALGRLHRCMMDMELSGQPWTLVAWSVLHSRSQASHDTLDIVHVQPLEALGCFWSGSPKLKPPAKRSGAKQQPRAARPRGARAAGVVEASSGCAVDPRPIMDAAGMEPDLESSASGEAEEAEEDEEEVADALEEWFEALLEEEDIDAWGADAPDEEAGANPEFPFAAAASDELSQPVGHIGGVSDDTQGDPPPPAAAEGSVVVVEHAGSALLEPPAPPPQPVDNRPRLAQHRPDGHGRSQPWMRWELPGLGALVLDETQNSLAAHCPLHPLCRMNRTLNSSRSRAHQGRPLGQLVAWLQYGPNVTTQAEHMRHRRSDDAVGYPARCRAREHLASFPDMDVVFALERPARPGERTEPLGLAG